METSDIKQTLELLKNSDLGAVAAIHVRAFPDSALSRLGAETVRRYYKWQLEGPHDAIAAGVFVDGVLKGFCFAGVFHGAASGFARRNFLHLTGALIRHPCVLFSSRFLQKGPRIAWAALRQMLCRSGSSGAGQRKPRSFGILAIATDPEWRGKGLGKSLMNYAETQARKRGFEAMHLSVRTDNARAVLFYENLGWKRMPEGPGWGGRMEKPVRGCRS